MIEEEKPDFIQERSDDKNCDYSQESSNIVQPPSSQAEEISFEDAYDAYLSMKKSPK